MCPDCDPGPGSSQQNGLMLIKGTVSTDGGKEEKGRLASTPSHCRVVIVVLLLFMMSGPTIVHGVTGVETRCGERKKLSLGQH